MQAYTAKLRRRYPFTTQYMALPPSIVLTPRKWSAADIGGPKAAVIDASGTVEDLAYLLTWLGSRAAIENEMGTEVWWGVVYEIEANLGGVSVSLSMESVYNRVAVIYPKTLPDGSTESTTTPWAEDAESIARYGRREWLYSLSEGDADVANSVRNRLLAQASDPAPVISTIGKSTVSATLHCRGQWQLLENYYWKNPKGFVSHEDGSGGSQPIGASLTDTTISFGAHARPPGMGDRDYIKDTGARFGSLVEGTVIKVSGAVEEDNNGRVTVQHLRSTSIIETVEDAQVDEVAGAMVTVALGEFGYVGWVSQEFESTSTATWLPTRVAFRVQKVGDPGDDLGVTINLDNGGLPGSNAGSTVRVVARGQIPASSVPTSMQWVEIPITPEDLDTGAGVSLWQGLQSGQRYWVTVGRVGGATSLSDHYVVGLDNTNSYRKSSSVAYKMKVYNGAWVDRISGENIKDADLNFRIIGEVDSIEQLKSAVATLPTSDFLEVLPLIDASGQPVRSYRGDERNVMDELMEILDLGTSDGDKLIAHVDTTNTIVVETVPGSSNINPMLGMDGQLRHASGALWEPGALVVGRWIDIESLPVLDALTKTKGQRAIYVQECEYDATRDRLMIQSEGASNPWQLIRWEKR